MAMFPGNPVRPATYFPPRKGGEDGGNMGGGYGGSVNPTLDQLLQYIMSDEMLTKKLAAEKELAHIHGDYGLKQQGMANENALTIEKLRDAGLTKREGMRGEVEKYKAGLLAEEAAALNALKQSELDLKIMDRITEQEVPTVLRAKVENGEAVMPIDPETGKPMITGAFVNGIRNEIRSVTKPISAVISGLGAGMLDLQNKENVERIAKETANYLAQSRREYEDTVPQLEKFKSEGAFIVKNFDKIENKRSVVRNPTGAIQSLSNKLHDKDNANDINNWSQWIEVNDGIFSPDERTIWNHIGNATNGGKNPMGVGDRSKLEKMLENMAAGPATMSELNVTFQHALQSAIEDNKSPELISQLTNITDTLSEMPHANFHMKKVHEYKGAQLLAQPDGEYPFNASLMRAHIGRIASNPEYSHMLQEAGVSPEQSLSMVKRITKGQIYDVAAVEMGALEKVQDSLQKAALDIGAKYTDEYAKRIEQRNDYARLSKLETQAKYAGMFMKNNPDSPVGQIALDKLKAERDAYKTKYGSFEEGLDPSISIEEFGSELMRIQSEKVTQAAEERDKAMAKYLGQQKQMQDSQPSGEVLETTTKYAPTAPQKINRWNGKPIPSAPVSSGRTRGGLTTHRLEAGEGFSNMFGSPVKQATPNQDAGNVATNPGDLGGVLGN